MMQAFVLVCCLAGVSMGALGQVGFNQVNHESDMTIQGQDCGDLYAGRVFDAGEGGGYSAHGDLDHDGDIDLIAYGKDDEDDLFRVLLQDEFGKFVLTGEVYPATNNGVGFLVDMNGDGDLDIVAKRGGFESFEVRFGNGDGSFGERSSYIVGIGYRDLRIGDLDQDGDLDVLVVEDYNPRMNASIRLNNGDGTFAPRMVFVAAQGMIGCELGDMNGDHILDIVTSNWTDDSVSVLLGNGDATYQTAQRFDTGDNPWSVRLGDVDGDGDLDVLSANQGGDSISVLLNSGEGVLNRLPDIDLGLDWSPHFMQVVDLNLDGLSDVIVSNGISSEAVVFHATGGGELARVQSLNLRVPLHGMEPSDLNQDGYPDLIISSLGGESVGYLANDGSGLLRSHTSYPVGSEPRDVQLADVNVDGYLDLIVANKRDENIGVLLSLGGDGFAPMVTHSLLREPSDIAMGDLNQDGYIDMMYSSYRDGRVIGLRGLGDGTFASMNSIIVGSQPWGVLLEDLDGNGTLDMVVAINGEDKIVVRLGNGAGQFGPGVQFSTGVDPWEIAAGDLDQDGDLDLVVSGIRDNLNLTTMLNNGDGEFEILEIGYSGSAFPRSVELADLNGDGVLDVITGNTGYGRIVVRFGVGDGTFGEYHILNGVGSPGDLEIADVNDDGFNDIVSSDGEIGGVTVHLGLGEGLFAAAQVFYSGESIACAIGDINLDGRIDIVTTDYKADRVAVLIQRCDVESCAVDLNGDGLLNLDDVMALLSAYAVDDESADLTEDGSLNYFDISVFMGLFIAGCS